MPIMTDRQSVPANGVVANALSGKLHEFVNEPSLIRLYGTGSAVGLNMSLIVGGEVVVQDQEVNAQNRLPIVPDDFIAEGGGLVGDRIVVSYRNTTGAAIIAFSRLETEPMA